MANGALGGQFSGVGSYGRDAYMGSPSVAAQNPADPLAALPLNNYSINPTTKEQNSRLNDFFWGNPSASMWEMLTQQGGGKTPSINSTAWKTLEQLSPGLNWLAYLSGYAPGTQLASDASASQWMGNLASWYNQAIGTPESQSFYGGAGNLSNLLGSIFTSVGNPESDLGGYMSQLSPDQLVQAIGQMIGTATFGQAAPQTVSGFMNNLQQYATQFLNSGIIQANRPETGTNPVSDAQLFLDWLRGNAPGVLSSLGLGSLGL